MFERRGHIKVFVPAMALVIVLGLAVGGYAYGVQLQSQLRHRIETQDANQTFTCRKELICGREELPSYYAGRAYRPAWIGSPDFYRLAESLLAYIHSVRKDGLNPYDYHLVNLEQLLNRLKAHASADNRVPPDLLVDTEILLTDAFLLLGSHLLAGRVDPETIHTKWIVMNPEANLTRVMQAAIETLQIAPMLNSLKPPHTGYRALKQALQQYRRISAAGGWPRLPADAIWRQGDYGARYALLRRQLEMTGDLQPGLSASRYLFDRYLEQGVRRFQYRHGLAVNGKIDSATLTALAFTARQRMKQIELNLERWRWIPHEMGRHRIEVNIADFRLAVIENNRPVMSMRVVVGRDYRKTPVFSRRMKYLVINPYWNIPQKIAYADVLPKVRRNPGYLERHNIKVFESWRRGAPEIDPDRVDWSGINEDNFVFKFRKEPGPRNDLGRIKFMFPNKFSIYLHDTPSRKLFTRSSRGLSSGCIRIEKPIELAEYLLRDDSRWTRADILEAIKKGERQVVRTPAEMPVHLLYRTAWVDTSGRLHFRKDIYNRDKPLLMALAERPPQI